MELLDQLAKLNADREELIEERERAIRTLMPEELRQQLDEVAEAFHQRVQGLDAERESLENAVRAQVLRGGETVKGAKLLAIFQEGKTSWDTKALDGYAAAHPEVAAFKKKGNPFVTIRER